MDFKAGDRVSFLDEEGKGVIRSVSAKGIARVLTDEGFELDYPVSKLVLAGGNKSAADETAIEEGVYLLFVPENQEKLVESDLSVVLANCSRYDICFSYSYKYHSEFVAMNSGGIGAGEAGEMDTIRREDIGQY